MLDETVRNFIKEMEENLKKEFSISLIYCGYKLDLALEKLNSPENLADKKFEKVAGFVVPEMSEEIKNSIAEAEKILYTQPQEIPQQKIEYDWGFYPKSE